MEPLPFGTRLFFAFAAFVRILFDPAFARRAFDVREPPKALPPKKKKKKALPAPPPKPPEPPSVDPAAEAASHREEGARQILSILQREGRFIDFVEQDVASFPDAEIGAAARVVHEGCRKALRSAGKLAPVRSEEEDSKIKVEKGFSPAEIKLTGNVGGEPPFSGTLRHKGWKMTEVTLPVPMKGHDSAVLAPAEVEL